MTQITKISGLEGKTIVRVQELTFNGTALFFSDDTFAFFKNPECHDGYNMDSFETDQVSDGILLELNIITEEEYRARDKARMARWTKLNEDRDRQQYERLRRQFENMKKEGEALG